MQPLKDNLPSITYQCFEDDTPKYDLYEKAIIEALENYKKNNSLKLNHNLIKDESRVLTACMLGAGRGPILKRIIMASIKTGVILNILCVEKNKNAFNTLLLLQRKEPETFKNVTFFNCDMRAYKPQTKVDIVVSELLGSFSDNELSPECLMNIQNYLSDDSIMIPQNYISYLRPVCTSVNFQNVK